MEGAWAGPQGTFCFLEKPGIDFLWCYKYGSGIANFVEIPKGPVSYGPNPFPKGVAAHAYFEINKPENLGNRKFAHQALLDSIVHTGRYFQWPEYFDIEEGFIICPRSATVGIAQTY